MDRTLRQDLPGSREARRSMTQTLKKQQKSAPPIEASMPCDAAFRNIARHYLEDMTAQHRDLGAARGIPQFDGVVVAARCDGAPIRRAGDRPHLARVPAERT